MKIKEDENTTITIGDAIASITGDQADTFRTKSYLEQYSKLISLKYKQKLTPELISRLFSTLIHESIRSNPLDIQGIIGGRSEDKSLKLFCVDKYGALHEDNFVVTGYGLFFLFGIFDLYYKPEMNENDSFELVRNCLKVIKERLVLETDKWRLDIIGPDGYRTEFVDLNK